MKYVCNLCGLASDDMEKVRLCETHGSVARYVVKQEVLFACKILGVPMEIRGTIEEAVHKLRTHNVSYRIFVGDDSRLKHKNCIYGGIPDKNVLHLVE